MHNFPPNVDWRWTTLLATVLGYIACGDFTTSEQNAIGNWILQIGQTVVTNASYQNLIEQRITGKNNINLNSKEFKAGGSPFINSQGSPNFEQFYDTFRTQFSDLELANLQKAIQKINEELESIRNSLEK